MSAEAHSLHVVPVKIYFAVFGVLLVGTALTVAVAYKDFGPLNNVFALGIATIKASCVVLFFMGVKYQTKLIHMIVWASIIWLGLLVVITLMDYFSRSGPNPVMGY